MSRGSRFPTLSAPRIRAPALLFVLTIAGLLIFASSPSLKRKLGLNLHDLWFADTYAVLAASDAVQAGMDPVVANPLDILQRPHVYSDWWYAIGRLGVTREQNFLVGASWVAGFFVLAWLLARPSDTRTALGYTLLLLSPPVLLAVNRGNNDLVIFILLSAGLLLLSRWPSYGWIAVLALIALATGLKFYPVVGAAIFLLLRPSRRILVATSAAVIVLAAVLINVWPSLGRGSFAMPATVHTMGAQILLRDLGYTGTIPVVAGLLIALAAITLVGKRFTAGLTDSGRNLESRAGFALGAVILVACFLAGVSFGYRWIFGLWLAPWFLAEMRDAQLPRSRRLSAQFGTWLLFTILWMDGLYCVAVNLIVGRMTQVQMAQWDQTWGRDWRLLSQPIAWIFIALLSGWLLEALLSTLRELRAGTARESVEPPRMKPGA